MNELPVLFRKGGNETYEKTNTILAQRRQDAKNCKNKLPFFKAGLGFFFFSSCPSCLRGEKVLIFVLVAALLG